MRPAAYDSCEPGRTTVPSAVSRCSSTVRKTPDWARAVCSSRTSGRQTGMVGPESYTRCRVSQRSVVGRSTGTHQRGAAPSRAMRCAVASSSSSCPTGASTRRLSGRRVRWRARGAAASGERGRGGWCAGRDGARPPRPRSRRSRRRWRARAAAGGRGRRGGGVRRAGSPGVRPAVCQGARVPRRWPGYSGRALAGPRRGGSRLARGRDVAREPQQLRQFDGGGWRLARRPPQQLGEFGGSLAARVRMPRGPQRLRRLDGGPLLPARRPARRRGGSFAAPVRRPLRTHRRPGSGSDTASAAPPGRPATPRRAPPLPSGRWR